MPEKRKDNNGRILRTGESQRANGTYCFRFTDAYSTRHCIYAKTLKELREKEESARRDIYDGIRYSAGNTTVYELAKRYLSMKRGLKKNTLKSYNSAMNRLESDPFGRMEIKKVKLSDAKCWFVLLHDNGLKQNTIGVVQAILKPAFEMVVDDDIIRKNPFKFRISDVVPNDAIKREAPTKEQQAQYLQFVQKYGKSYYNDIVVLLGTGLRISELYGLTKSDIDFDKRCVHVRRQLCRTVGKPYFIEKPKSESGVRDIPMTDAVFMALKRELKSRELYQVEYLVDGVSGFVFLNKVGRPKVARHIQLYMQNLWEKYKKAYGDLTPKVTPHVLRHTFCTNAQQDGLDIKSLQYLMGHSNIDVTLSIYTHSDYESVERAFSKIYHSI